MMNIVSIYSNRLNGHRKQPGVEPKLIPLWVHLRRSSLSVSRNDDANGNVTEYVSESGAVVASYAYDAFGNLLSATGPMADAFSHRFSTKYRDAETGLYYYGYRFYSPEMGRWINRDPIEEEGGENLYAFCLNLPICSFDFLGQSLLDVRAERIRSYLAMGMEDMAANEAYLLYCNLVQGGNIAEPLAAQLLDFWLMGKAGANGRNAFIVSGSHVKSAMLYDKPANNNPKAQLTEALCNVIQGNTGGQLTTPVLLTAFEGVYYWG